MIISLQRNVSFSGESEVIIESGSTIYQLYQAPVNWFQAERVCGRCETGRIVQQHTESIKNFIVDNVISGKGW